MEIVQEKDKDKLSSEVVEYISLLVKQAISFEKSVLLLLSGGSVLDVVDQLPDAIFSPSITVGMIDERFSVDVDSNNFLQLQGKGIYRRLTSLGAHSINSIPRENESLHDFAKRIENSWKEWQHAHVGGVVIALMGMGQDGHTAGIMPYLQEEETLEKLFTETTAWVFGYDTGDKNKYRLRATATFPFLKNEVDEAIVYITGEEKEEALRKAMQEGPLSEIPARIFKEMRSVRIFTTNNV